MRYECVSAKNGPSPLNEDEWINAYHKAFPISLRKDGYDVAAVITRLGTIGHAMMPQGLNRSKDDEHHLCYNFISDDELRRFL